MQDSSISNLAGQPNNEADSISSLPWQPKSEAGGMAHKVYRPGNFQQYCPPLVKRDTPSETLEGGVLLKQSHRSHDLQSTSH